MGCTGSVTTGKEPTPTLPSFPLVIHHPTYRSGKPRPMYVQTMQCLFGLFITQLSTQGKCLGARHVSPAQQGAGHVAILGNAQCGGVAVKGFAVGLIWWEREAQMCRTPGMGLVVSVLWFDTCFSPPTCACTESRCESSPSPAALHLSTPRGGGCLWFTWDGLWVVLQG